MRFAVIAITLLSAATISTPTAADSRAFGTQWRRPLTWLARHIGKDATQGVLRPLMRGYIEFMRDVARKDARPLADDEKRFLREFFPVRLIDAVRIAELGVAGLGNPSAGAAAYGADLIVVKRGFRTRAILKHEMVHVCQYDKLGIAEFARRYANQFVEADFVYDRVKFEEEAHRFKLNGRGPFVGMLGPCE